MIWRKRHRTVGRGSILFLEFAAISRGMREVRRHPARTVNRRDGKSDSPVPNVSQAPQAVRSAGGRRWDGAFLTRARADRTFCADKRDAVGLTIQIHWLRNISSTAAIRAGIQSAFSPSGLRALCMKKTRSPPVIDLCYESRTRFAQGRRSNVPHTPYPKCRKRAEQLRVVERGSPD